MSITPPDPGLHQLQHYRPPPDTGLQVVHEDAHVLVLDKPPGLLSVPGRGAHVADCLSSRVQARFADALIVHRLDMDTSGLILMARSPEALRAFSGLFETRKVHKRYEAVVSGVMADEQGEVALPLITDWPRRPRQKVDWDMGRYALTRWQVIGPETEGTCTRVSLEPVTGRSHQLRVHMMSLGHPIVGDRLYADPPASDGARLLLHASELSLCHPFTGQPMCWRSPAPF